MANYPLNEPVRRSFLFDEEQQKFLVEKYQEVKNRLKRARTYDGAGTSTSYSRTCEHVSVNYTEIPDISIELKTMLDDWFPERESELWWAQFEYVRYLPGQEFSWHRDDVKDGTQHNRYYTSVTMIEKSDDLEGGNLRIILPNTNTELDVQLEPFETVLFPAWFRHAVVPVFKGERTILISWAGKGYRTHIGELIRKEREKTLPYQAT